MTLHGSNTSLASADQTLSGSETEDLVTPQVIFLGLTCIQRSENQPHQKAVVGPLLNNHT